MSLSDLLMQLQDTADYRYAGDFGHLPEPQAQMPMPMPMPQQQPQQGGGLNSSLMALAMGAARSHRAGGGGGGGGYPAGSVPSGRGIFFNSDVDVLQPGDPRLVDRFGVTLARPAARSLAGIFRPGMDIGGGYRSPGEQSSLYASKPGVAAPPGSSYHQEGLAIDLASQFQKPRWERQLAAAGWNQLPGEPWHWSYGVRG